MDNNDTLFFQTLHHVSGSNRFRKERVLEDSPGFHDTTEARWRFKLQHCQGKVTPDQVLSTRHQGTKGGGEGVFGAVEPGAIWSPKALHCLARSHGVLNHIETLGTNARNKREIKPEEGSMFRRGSDS